MPRKSTFSDEQIFEPIAREMAAEGQLSIETLVQSTGVSTGSLYHRYGSREGILGEAWLDAVGVFQERFLAALQSGLETAGRDAACTTPEFCRSNRHRALILMACRQTDFLGPKTPETLRKLAKAANVEVFEAIQSFADERGVSVEKCHLALIGFPLGAVKLYLPNRAVPLAVDDAIRAAYAVTIDASDP